MADSFKTFLVKDALIGDITPDLDYAVQQGAAQKTFQSFVATSTSNSSVTFNVNIPSENVVVDRNVLVQVPLTFTIQTAPVPIGTVCPLWGQSVSFNSFPYAMLQQTCTVSINNTSQTVNVQDVLPQLLRMNDSRELYRYNGMTPSLPDQAYQSLLDASSGKNNNPMADYSNSSYDNCQLSRGGFPVGVEYYQFASGASVPVGGLDPTETVTAQSANAYWKIVVTTVVTEPIFVSPLAFGQPGRDAMGIVGVNNITITQNIDATLKRLVSWGGSIGAASISPGCTLYNTSVSPSTFVSSNTNLFNIALATEYFTSPAQPTLLLNFLSVQANEAISAKNAVPLMDYPRYLTPSNSGVALTTGTLTRINSSNLQLNQVPDLLIIAVRKPMASQTIADANSFFKINSVSINFNNASGLLSSASAQDLWRMSVKNGSQQNWSEFNGLAYLCDGLEPGALVATTGSLLVLNPAMDLSLPPFLSCGSLGQFNLQLSLDVANLSPTATVPEIIITCVNSGVFVTSQGQSKSYTGILTREMVLSTAESKEWKSSVEEARLTGGMLMGRSGARKPMMRRMMGGVPSGGAMSGGARTRLSGMY